MLSPFSPLLPDHNQPSVTWGGCDPTVFHLALAQAAQQQAGPLLLVTSDIQQAGYIAAELRFFTTDPALPIISFPDWETLPYDVFSPLPELISERLLTLHKLRNLAQGIVIVPVATLMQRILPPTFLDAHSAVLQTGQTLDFDTFRRNLEQAGYQSVAQVMAHGEFAVRGSLIDLFPMGSPTPLRLDLLDDEIDSIRTFDPETQCTVQKIDQIALLPAREFPLDKEAIQRFRAAWRATFTGDPQHSLIYRDVSAQQLPGGIEYYLPLFHTETATLFNYLPRNTLITYPQHLATEADTFFSHITERYTQRCSDVERPILAPEALYLKSAELMQHIAPFRQLRQQPQPLERDQNFAAQPLPALSLQPRAEDPFAHLQRFLAQHTGRILFMAETAGRREALLETLRNAQIKLQLVADWNAFLQHSARYCLTIGPLEQGLWLHEPALAVLPEALLLGERVQQRRRQRKGPDADLVVRNLAELQIGSPVVHEAHGVGRYQGLQVLDVGDTTTEFLMLEYAQQDKLYVPVADLHLISRYTGASAENAPLHRLGTNQWEKAKRKAAERVHDVAAELLDIYAQREARQGQALPAPDSAYQQFAAAFEFEETPDQASAIQAVIHDLTATKPMDRVVCGDVGFGKTEVAMRAACMVVNSGKQVAVLVPTTLLSQQHYENFADRFADWPVRVDNLSRFRAQKEITKIRNGLAEGTLDIVIGTHKLLNPTVKFKDLGLVIIDEEHRFGVRHKERLKALRAEVDILTLTATPIPRTLNMAMAGMRDLSIIATPPAARHPIKTFISEWNDTRITEACQREISRGGQIYLLHNSVSTIAKTADKISQLIPQARVEFAHGQMRERELERIMRDFYHQRFHILVCTTIIESGIDIPTANTIIIDRADKLGLAQLHQLRGRVGRSHHRAYAYLITPPLKNLTADARKRLQAIESLEELGAGFTLATHDMEIRGAGELLGDEQSGQIHEIGFTLYTEMLERAVAAIKNAEQPALTQPLEPTAQVDLHIPALLPEDYVPDVHLRLIQYKRIASAATTQALRELKIEMIDRFGLLPEPAQHLMDVTALKLRLQQLGIRKIEAGPQGGRLLFTDAPTIDGAILIQLIQSQPTIYRLDGPSKLHFKINMPTPAERVQVVTTLLDKLAAQAA